MMNKFLNVVLTESPLDSPFAPKEKCIAPAVGAALVAGGSSLLGGLMNLFEQADTNKTNLDIAKMNQYNVMRTNQSNQFISQQTNAMNRAMMREQNAFNLDMWNKQNSYNSPQHQVELLKAAGLNPSMMFGQVTPAGSLQSANANPAQASYNVAPQLDYQKNPLNYGAMFDSVGNAINAFYQNQMLSSEAARSKSLTVGSDISNDKERKSMESFLQRLENEAKESGYRGESARRQLEFYNASFNTRLRLVQGDANIQDKQLNMLDEQLNGVQLDNTLRKIQVAFQQKLNNKQLAQMDATLSQIYAQIGLINSNRLLTDEQRLHEIEKKVGQTIENGLKGISYDIQKETKQYVIDDVQSQSVMNRWNAIDSSRNPRRQIGTNRDMRDYVDFSDFERFSDKASKMFKYKVHL